jgi:hypothetical protein
VDIPIGRILRDLELEGRRIPVGHESRRRSLIGWGLYGTQDAIVLDNVSGAGGKEILKVSQPVSSKPAEEGLLNLRMSRPWVWRS